jgi:hypothetical protein
MRHHAGIHRVELDVTVDRKKIALVLDETGAISALPKRSGAPAQIVENADVAPTHVLHHP